MNDYDRGAFRKLSFDKCARGYTLTGGYDIHRDIVGPVFAFDRIEDLAAWLVEQYAEVPSLDSPVTETGDA